MINFAQSAVSGLMLGGILALAAVGLTLVLGVMDVVNFAHGEFIMLGMYVAFFAWSLVGLDPLVAIPICAVAVAAFGCLVYIGPIRRVLGYNMLAQMMVTFGLVLFLRGLVQYLWSPDPHRTQNTWAGHLGFTVHGVVFIGPQVAAAIGALLCTGLVGWLVHRTKTGKALQAAGEDRMGAALMGIDPDRMFALAWVLTGGATGVAGALLINQFAAEPLAGVRFGLIAFVAVALGGFGSIGGAAVAGLLLGVVQAIVGLYASGYSIAAAMGIYLVVIMVRPYGLKGAH